MSADLVKRLLACPGLHLDPASLVVVGATTCKALTPDGPVILRLVPAGDGRRGRFLPTLLRRESAADDMLQPLRAVARSGDDLVVILEWLPGSTLREGCRELLPFYFERLAAWHRDNACDLPVYSPYTERESSSLGTFLDGEISYHLDLLKLPHLQKLCRLLLSPLTDGFVTHVHGDVHPDNMLVGTDRRYRLLDPEFLHISCNYLDLDYIDWFALEPDPVPWWVIRDHGRESVVAYFRALGVAEACIPHTMRSVALLSALRGHTNAQRHQPSAIAEARLRVERILSGKHEQPLL